MSANKPITLFLRRGLKVILPLIALAVGVSSYKTLKSNGPTPPKAVKREIVQPVRTLKIHLASHQPALKLYGEIRSGRSVELRALVAGKVLNTGDHFREGAQVKKGELLLAIDPFSYQGAVVEARARIVEARARLKEIKAQIKAEKDSIIYAEEQLKLARRDLERARKLVRKGSVTRQGAELRELTVSQRRQALDSRRANLTILQARAEQQVAGLDSLQWRLRQAERNRHDTDLKAPFNGYISEVNANVGRLLNVNDRVAMLIDSNWMDVVFTLSDRQYGRLLQGRDGLIGRRVAITWKLGATPLHFKGIVERVGARISSESGGVSVYARLEDPSLPRPIRAGAFVDVELPDQIYHKVARLPQTALYNRTKVYVVGPKMRLLEREVTLRAIDGEFVLVSGHLAEGERVVVTRMSTIGGGIKVRDLNTPSGPDAKPADSGGGDKTGKIGKDIKSGLTIKRSALEEIRREEIRRENSRKPKPGGALSDDGNKAKLKQRRGGHEAGSGERQNRG